MKTKTLLKTLASALAAACLPLNADPFPYVADFEAGAGPEWSNRTTDVTPLGNRRFLGQFGNHTVSLTLSNLPSHAEVTVSFDLFTIRTWDGSGAGWADIWDLRVIDGPTLLHTTFSTGNPGEQTQDFPDAYPGGHYPPYAGAQETNTLGYLWADPRDAVYHLAYTFPHTHEVLKFVFSASGLESLSNESWGLDNVRVELTRNDSISLLQETYSITETNAAMLVAVRRLGPEHLIEEVAVDYATVDETARAGEDYLATSGTLRFAAGETNRFIAIPILNDGVREPNETFQLLLTNVTTGMLLGHPDSASIRIMDNDVGITFVSTNVSVGEADDHATLTVVRGDDLNIPFTVDYTTTDETAHAGEDYVATSGTLHFAAGDTNKLIAISILDDTVTDEGKQFRVVLSNPTGGVSLGNSNAVIRIQDDELLFYDDFESYAIGSFPGNGWSLVYEGAGADAQQVAASPGGRTGKAFLLNGVSGWCARAYRPVEFPPYFAVECLLYSAEGLGFGGYNPTLGTWGDHYARVGFLEEQIQASPRVYRDLGAIDCLWVPLIPYQSNTWYRVRSVVDLISRSFNVYVDGQLVGQDLPILEPGQPLGVEVSCDISSCWVDEVKVLNVCPTGGVVRLRQTSFTVAENAGVVSAEVLRFGPAPLAEEISVDYVTVDGTARAGEDYVATSGTLHFAAGETNKQIAIRILEDPLVEDMEQFRLVLSNLTSGASLGVSNVVIRIWDNEPRYVNVANPNPVFPYTSWATAATNIQDAVDAAGPGSLVLVTNGVYAVGAREASRFNEEWGDWEDVGSSRVVVTNFIRLESVNGPLATLIDGGGSVRCVYLGKNAMLGGFTLTNGFAKKGGGAYCEAGGILTNCTLTANESRNMCGVRYNWHPCGYGGGAYGGTLYDCTLDGNYANRAGGGASDCTLYNCAITGNQADSGGGVSDSIIHGCTLMGNWADLDGGAVSSTLNDCVVSDNWGDGAALSTLYNCTVSDNEYSGASGSTLYNCTVTGNGGGGVGNWWGVASTVFNSIVYYNYGGNYDTDTILNHCCTTPLPTNGVGNITGSPLFMDWYAGDFRLREESPCIDAGTNLVGLTMPITNQWGEASVLTYAHDPTDILGNTRFIDGDFDGRVAWDIGAYEFNSYKPPRFSHPPRLTVNGWQLTITGAHNKWVRVQRSSDLQNWEDCYWEDQWWSPWVWMGPEGVKQVTDGDMGQRMMFYRVVVE